MTLTSPKKLTVRKIDFNFTSKEEKYWLGNCPFCTHSVNAMSILLPAAEKSFVQSIKIFKDTLNDEKDKEELQNFILQEASHNIQHKLYNQALTDQGYSANKYQDFASNFSEKMIKKLSPINRLAMVVGFEHINAIFSTMGLKNPRCLENSNSKFAHLWRWHFAEEIEHQHVAYNIYKASNGGYIRRIHMFMVSIHIFYIAATLYRLRLLHHDKLLFNIKGHWKLFKRRWINPGFVWQIAPAFFQFFKPSFTPSTDNLYLIKEWEEKNLDK